MAEPAEPLNERADQAVDTVTAAQQALQSGFDDIGTLKKNIKAARKIIERASEVLSELSDTLDSVESDIESYEELQPSERADSLEAVLELLVEIGGIEFEEEES